MVVVDGVGVGVGVDDVGRATRICHWRRVYPVLALVGNAPNCVAVEEGHHPLTRDEGECGRPVDASGLQVGQDVWTSC